MVDGGSWGLLPSVTKTRTSHILKPHVLPNINWGSSVNRWSWKRTKTVCDSEVIWLTIPSFSKVFLLFVFDMTFNALFFLSLWLCGCDLSLGRSLGIHTVSLELGSLIFQQRFSKWLTWGDNGTESAWSAAEHGPLQCLVWKNRNDSNNQEHTKLIKLYMEP